MDIDPNETKKAISRGTFFGFIPHRLELAGFPKFYNYPFNVMFQSFSIKDGKQISGTVLYEPEFSTFRKEENLSCMRYRNVYGGNSHLMIGYDEENKRYSGEKFVNNEMVGSADGGDDWNKFFIHLTMLGLANGERCEFNKMD